MTEGLVRAGLAVQALARPLAGARSAQCVRAVAGVAVPAALAVQALARPLLFGEKKTQGEGFPPLAVSPINVLPSSTRAESNRAYIVIFGLPT